ncbi:MAG TPA: SRPBCC domain-containing protein [Candidatus Binataceae bacterium]|nr:SRPBCC domain-containing protein [Candidatus Binataceae bacterium]
MAAKSNLAAAAAEERVLVIERIFDAPREVVWRAWTEPDQMARWLGPKGFTGDVEKMEPQVGGSYRFHLREPDGSDHWMQGVNREVAPPERLVYTMAWADAKGEPTTPETLVTVTFAEHAGGRTRLILRQEGFESSSARDEHRFGWNSAFDCLAEYLATLAN